MNPTPDNETTTLRSEIDQTRRRMDNTMEALGERLQGRHLIDELLGFFRRDAGQTRELGQKFSRGASSVMHSLTDSVKANPLPALLIGAGVAWMIYDRRRQPALDDFEERYDEAAGAYENVENDPDAESLYDRPLEYSSSTAAQRSFDETGETAGNPSSFAEGQSKLGQARNKLRTKLSDVGFRMRDRSRAASEHARQLGSRVQERARETYQRGRDRVVTTVDERPLEVGLACLAAGVIVGLTLPTPERLRRLTGPSMERLRDRTREAGHELLQKGQRVAAAAADAAKHEARSQGLTPEGLREQAGSGMKQEPEIASASASGAGAEPGRAGGIPLRENQSGSVSDASSQPKSDPLAARPVM